MSQFSSRAEQLEYFFKKYIVFVGGLFGPEYEEEVKKVDSLPGILVISRALDVLERHKQRLQARDMTAVVQIVLENAPKDGNMEKMMISVMKVCDKIQNDENVHSKFWKLTDLLIKIAN